MWMIISFAVLVVVALVFFYIVMRGEFKRQDNTNDKTKTGLYEDWRKFKIDLNSEVKNFKRSMKQYIHDKVGSDRQIRKLERKMNNADRKKT